MSAVEVRDLTKEYGRGPTAHTALRGVSFDVAEGELLSVVGPSGCGKTTLLKCVAGLLPATSGGAWVLGQRAHGVPDGLAVVFQDYSRSLFPWMRVGRNVGFPLRSAGLRRAERRERVAAALASVGLADRADHYPWQLSGGMQQRVAIARALAYRPRVLLMDEPFASVDAQTRAGLEDLTRRVHQESRMTILFVTHDIDESVYLADRVLVLRRSPGAVLTELTVDLPDARDQITTRALPEFVGQRRLVAEHIRTASAPAPVPPRDAVPS
ncbi:Taurine import ATP-binding protein TauB (plasmid) [Streptomyces sp. YIM 121038]|uniref:ABC transporter ATP-binding protein n=1 Tax=Streptomyces sp. YIM 121038 TaxID=2136401 RepID=UPI001110D2AA|nr:ABC transporter ATP-binding protein [Streptomyces sp. YIM 121038]QCX82753.1 Taurine import ATP-binding protein TauB [Streptomyces sp. YIM 121038]